MNNVTMVAIKGLSYQYPNNPTPTLLPLDLSIPRGSRFGLFGPNGAGKTTLISLMTGLLPYTSGQILMNGQELRQHQKAIKKQMGFVPQDFSFYEELSPRENMAFFGAWYGLQAAQIKQSTQSLLEILGLSSVANKPLREFSGGMKRRVNLAIGVMHQPKLLFLDEPTVGVDVQSRHAILEFLKTINAQGTTLVYTSHLLQEAEELCTEVALIDQGHIVAQGRLPSLLQQYQQTNLEGLFLQLTGQAYRD